MASRSNGAMLRQLGTLFNLGAIGEQTDGQLLERFATRGGEEGELAFAALVERHGQMVWRVCRSTLRDPNDAQDAFQAAFLVLVQKAKSLWVRDSLGPWLHRVAHRVAARARRDAARRLEHERKTAEARPAATSDDHGDDDLAAMLHDEIERLPARCREPLILCDVQGLTHQDAARRLGWPLGTVKTRLARARVLLRGRLARRNGLPSGLLIAAPRLASAFRNEPNAPAAFLIESTVRAATAVATGEAVALKVISAPVAVLFKEVLHAMFLTKLKIASAVVLTAVTAAGLAGAVAQSGGDGKPGPSLEANQPPRATAPASRTSDTPDFVSKSRAMILKRLEEEAEEANWKLNAAMINTIDVARKARAERRGSEDEGPVVNQARKEFLDLQTQLDKIDRILFDVIEAHPTLFKFSPAPSEKAGDPGDAEIQSGLDREIVPADVLRAKKRVAWAQMMFEKGYVSKSQLDAEISSFERALAQAQTLKEQNLKSIERRRDGAAVKP
ncbi:MAG: RNA polymerase sigma factor [Paludisphaera borealis]|uniref:RNA polymerase sigma factor n=1 Tax=Paludisphaera borealis TaxID=1387353 RepID=UPI00284A8E07|nr:RNA polymerase sigma factor [Paludisphaera borealis]MDR3621265.1 RNA polymerase sigma factor [Paludisphaera borealis]